MAGTDLPTLSAADQARALTRILLPPVLKGPIIRRPRVVNLAERFDIDSGGVTEMRRLRDRYGPGPVRMNLLGRRVALNHFEPDNALVSSAEKRLARRPLNERALETGTAVHSHVEAMTGAIEREVASLLGHADFTGTLDWDGSITAA